jgi:hypothetical protein
MCSGSVNLKTTLMNAPRRTTFPVYTAAAIAFLLRKTLLEIQSLFLRFVPRLSW